MVFNREQIQGGIYIPSFSGIMIHISIVGRILPQPDIMFLDILTEFCDAFSLYDHSNKRRILVKDVPHVCRILGYNETSLAYDDAISTARTKTGEAG
jgi:hypothetical protein